MMRDKDWSASTIGPVATWPQSLRSMLSAVFNSPMLGAVLWGPELLFFYNDAYIPSLGQRHPDGLGRPVSEVWGSAWDQVSELFYGCLASGIGFEMSDVEIPMNRNGEHVTTYWDFSATPIYGEDDTIVGLLNQGIEITGRVIADREKSAIAGKLNFQLTLADRLRSMADPEEVVTAASELLGKHLGVARVLYGAADESGEILRIKRDWGNGTLPSIAGVELKIDDFGPVIGEAVRTGQTVAVTDVMNDERSSSYVHAYSSVGIRAFLAIPLIKRGKLKAILSLHDGPPRHWTERDVALAQDMVERTWLAEESAHAQAELRAERDRSQAVFDTMTEGFVIIDRNWTVLYMNTEGLRLSGRTASQAIGQHHWKVWFELIDSDPYHLYRRVMVTRQPEMMEFVFTYPDAKTAWLELRAYPVDDGIAVLIRDITDRREAEAKLHDADQRKDEFLAMLAHELRNPLAPIGAAAELLQLVKLDDERVKKTSAVIGRQVKHMTGLIDDLLDVSRVTQGLIELDNGVIDIHQVVSEAVEQVSPLIRSRGHELTLRLSPQTALVHGDQKRLVQVLANILNNAAKYTAEGGHLVLCTSVRESDVLIEVIDNGIGMTADMTKRAFDLFAQAERTSDRSSGGLGIGLALVRSLVELHGGTISCDSNGLGTGSTFTIYLPLLRQEVDSRSRHLDENASVGTTDTSLRILVVDDNIDAAEMLKMFLEAMGHYVFVEHGSRQALERAKLDRPQVCLLDIGLPEMDGNELARQLRARPENREAVLIAVTGYGQEIDRINAISSGFDHHLIKPLDPSKLLSILSTVKVS